ncbi:MAG: biotin--[acetyl-CoA-carboxylase] ligase [Clostridia bacterium]|nr:biotin--[acetyl-CoA-carboxylase] ligase [Clostridia bacterium]
MASKLESELTKRGIDIPCFCLSKTGSTNEDAKKLIKDGKITSRGVIIAKKQTQGRGRYGREFVSPKGGIYLSFVFKVPQKAFKFPSFGIYSAFAASYAFQDSGFGIYDKISIKWPNDILMNDRKIAGILPENISNGSDRYVIIGIGVNVNTVKKPLVSLPHASSVRLERNFKCDIDNLAANIVEEMNRAVDMFYSDAKAKASMLEQYKRLCVTLGSTIEYTDKGGNMVIGKAIDVLVDGALMIEKVDGTTDIIGWGEISQALG